MLPAAEAVADLDGDEAERAQQRAGGRVHGLHARVRDDLPAAPEPAAGDVEAELGDLVAVVLVVEAGRHERRDAERDDDERSRHPPTIQAAVEASAIAVTPATTAVDERGDPGRDRALDHPVGAHARVERVGRLAQDHRARECR